MHGREALNISLDAPYAWSRGSMILYMSVEIATSEFKELALGIESGMARLSFREQVLRVREDAIINSVNRLLAEKGFDSMTVDEVAADVGIAKASLYKHFASKEALAAAAMVRALQRALLAIEAEAAKPEASAFDRLQALTRWTLQVQLAGEMPSLPSQNSTLRTALAADKTYVDLLLQVSERLGEWIVQAQQDGRLTSKLPPQVILYTLFARACDPVLGFLKAGGQHSDEQIADWVLSTCLDGLAARP
jgi:TetR/AcrR family transcriptional regulator of autoinduction and epiphytic fitness